MSQLKIGLFTNADFAQWRGVSQTTITSHKKKYLQDLSNYAEWHKEGRKVYIDKVLEKEYQPKRRENINKIEKEFQKQWKAGKPDTCKHVSEKIINQFKKQGNPLQITNNTVYVDVVNSRTRLYGRPFREKGKLGRCIYILCKKIDEDYQLFTNEERQIKDHLLKVYFGDVTEKALMVKLMVKQGELESNDAWEYFEDISNIGKEDKYNAFLADLEVRIGEKVARATLLIQDEVEESAF